MSSGALSTSALSQGSSSAPSSGVPIVTFVPTTAFSPSPSPTSLLVTTTVSTLNPSSSAITVVTATAVPIAPTPEAEQSTRSRGPVGIIVGAFVAGVMVVTILGLLLWRRKRRESRSYDPPRSVSTESFTMVDDTKLCSDEEVAIRSTISGHCSFSNESATGTSQIAHSPIPLAPLYLRDSRISSAEISTANLDVPRTLSSPGFRLATAAVRTSPVSHTTTPSIRSTSVFVEDLPML